MQPSESDRGVRVPALRRPGAVPGAWILEFYRSNVGKKAVMAVTGIVLLAYVLLHMIGNLKLYQGAEELNAYAEWLRTIGYPGLPEEGALWLMRGLLLVSFVLHIHAATVLTLTNRKARPIGYKSRRDFAVASYAARTMRWTGIIVLLFVVYHLLHLTTGDAHHDFVEHDVYHNVVEGFQRWEVSAFYIVANLALGLHIFHGVWSLFQSLGWNNKRFNPWRRSFAAIFTIVVVAGNVSFPIAVLTGIVD
jgi:succinate dehydrogenase / fumarate reductase, cytochrome b subunit